MKAGIALIVSAFVVLVAGLLAGADDSRVGKAVVCVVAAVFMAAGVVCVVVAAP
jgi:hypothetical protein